MKNLAMSRRHFLSAAAVVALANSVLSMPTWGKDNNFISPLWDMTKINKGVLKLSVWFRAQDVDQLLSTPPGLDKAVNWCKQHGVTKVYLEAYGRGLFANRKTLVNAKERFLKEALEVQGGVLTANGPDNFNKYHCYTSK